MIAAPRATETVCVMFEIDENEMRTVLAHPRAMIGSDGIPQDGGVPHPRLVGAFPRVLGQYGRDEGLFDLPSAVKKMTSIPAQRFGLTGRGRIQPGCRADITIFDHSTINDRATYQERNPPDGIEWVLVNGAIAVTPDGLSDALAGEVLTRNPGNDVRTCRGRVQPRQDVNGSIGKIGRGTRCHGRAAMSDCVGPGVATRMILVVSGAMCWKLDAVFMTTI